MLPELASSRDLQTPRTCLDVDDGRQHYEELIEPILKDPKWILYIYRAKAIAEDLIDNIVAAAHKLLDAASVTGAVFQKKSQ